MDAFNEYLDSIQQPIAREKTREAIAWVSARYPRLGNRMAWSQPMFTDHGTFIISFNAFKDYLAISPEGKTLHVFEEELKARGYRPTKMIFRVPWTQTVDWDLLSRIIDYNIADKKDCATFWRPKEDWPGDM